jgi:DNA-binding LacI/PurR family transcriptional regulator
MAEPSNPNILEVAKRAGVSTATVSRVLSPSQYGFRQNAAAGD